MEKRDIESIRNLSYSELDNIYRSGKALSFPDGKLKGVVLLSVFGRRAKFLNSLAEIFWKGKIFYKRKRILKNKVLCFEIFTARLRFGKSLFDGKTSLFIDYSKSSMWPVSSVVDEIREISKGLYLGRVYRNGSFRNYFALGK